MPNLENIQHVPNKKIDRQKWDHAVLNSVDGKIYATCAWLDNMCAGWNALVLGDYKTIMPLPAKRKWRINYLAQPPFTQQLGLFSTKKITPTIYLQFITLAQKLYPFGEIAVHLPQNFPKENFTIDIRKNYLLDLSVGYAQIQANYSNDLAKKNLQRSKKFNLQYVVSADVDNAVQLFKDLYGDRTPHVTDKNYQQLLYLAKEMLEKKQAFVREVKLPNSNALLACGLFFKYENRIYNIASSTLPDGRTMEANHFLFDQLIQEFAGTNTILDFEGSDLPGVERFYKKFGAILAPYYFIKWNNLPKLIRLFKK